MATTKTIQEGTTRPTTGEQHIRPTIHQTGKKWMHTVCGYPIISTWCKAAKAGNFVGWPRLTKKNLNKYYPERDETPKGHMNQQQKNVRSTKTPFEVCNGAAALRGKKIKDIFVSTYGTRKQASATKPANSPNNQNVDTSTSWSSSK
jgi:hypothetical protein